jgi:hypothetical protein
MDKSESSFSNILSWGGVNPKEFPNRNIPKPKSTCGCASRMEYYSHKNNGNCSCTGGWKGYESGHGNAFCNTYK